MADPDPSSDGDQIPDGRFWARQRGGRWGLVQRGGYETGPPWWSTLRYRTDDDGPGAPFDIVGVPIRVLNPSQDELAALVAAAIPENVAKELVAIIFSKRRGAPSR